LGFKELFDIIDKQTKKQNTFPYKYDVKMITDIGHNNTVTNNKISS